MPHDQWPSCPEGIQYQLEGPYADSLIDCKDIYDQVVYKDIHALPDEWDIVTESEAEPYLPKRKGPLNVTVGIETKTSIDLPTFSSIKLDDHFKYKKGFIINTGSSIWGLDFVPKLASNESNPLIQYLAVSGYRGSTEEHIGMNEIQPTGSYKNSIQIWKLKLSVKEASEAPLLDLCLLHDFGVVFDLKWCPYGAYEEQGENGLPKLGILSVICGDGTTRIIIVPHPDTVRKHMGVSNDQTVYIKIKTARCTLNVKGHSPMRLSWGGHKKLAVGCTSGSIIIWDMISLLSLDNKSKNELESLPHVLQSVLVLDASISAICWNGIRNPDRLVVAGYDGHVMVIDTNDPAMHLSLVRLRNIARTGTWVSHWPAVFFSDNDGVARGVMMNENGSSASLKYAVTPGACWDMAASEHHHQISLVTSIGWLRTSNMHQERSRYSLVNAVSVYKLDYSETTGGYRYIDGIGLQNMDDSKKLNTYQQYGETSMALQKVVWNPNKRTSGFIAAGGVSGLCRIDFEGRGSKWE